MYPTVHKAVARIIKLPLVKYERTEGTLNEYAGERMHPADIKKRPIHPAHVGGIPRKTSPAPTNKTGRALTSGYTVVKSAPRDITPSNPVVEE